MKKFKSAFTLLELIVVLAVVGILGTLGYNKFTEIMLDTKSTQLSDQLKKIEIGMSKYLSDLGTYPLDVNWLVSDKMDKDTAKGYDSLSLKLADGEEDPDVMEYWSGPYIDNMKVITEENSDLKKIQAVFGDKIEVCAKITDESGVSKIESCGTDVSDADSYINVLIIKGVDPQAINYLFKKINGREMNEKELEKGNAIAVATGKANSTDDAYYKSDKLGVPGRANYGETTPFIIYKFADNIQN